MRPEHGAPDRVDDADLLTSLYGLPPPVTIFSLMGADGINNLIRGVRSGDDEYIWKQYRTHGDLDALRSEHRLLSWLAAQSLSFGIPAPQRTRHDDTLYPLPDGSGWAALFPRLPGVRLDRRNPVLIGALGASLAELHAALAAAPPDLRPALPPTNTLEQVRAHLPHPTTLTPGDLGLSDEPALVASFAWWRDLLASLTPFLESNYRALPRQIIHGDFGPGNALAGDGRITAILDFEFALYDRRALDVAAGLVFCMRTWEWPPEQSLRMAAAFCQGYRSRGMLTAPEIAAIPRLMLLRDIVAAIWWLGREDQSGSLAASNLWRISDLQQFVAWLSDHEVTLLALIEQAMH